ncbi:MAG: hypothetical protein R6U78_08555 [Bacteroidales bacterium]
MPFAGKYRGMLLIPGGFLRYWLNLYTVHLLHFLSYLHIKIRV